MQHHVASVRFFCVKPATLYVLGNNIWYQSQETSSLDRRCQFSLMLGADGRAFMTDNLAVSINKILQDFHFLIINLFEIVGAKVTLFLW